MSGILDTIGNTPLLELKSVWNGERNVRIYAKAEYLNPSGSVKDRAAKAMLLSAIRSGELTPDKIIIDATSGSTGMSFAMIGAALGYQVILCMPSNVSVERKRSILAYGAMIVETNPLEGVDGAVEQVRELVASQPNLYYYPDQYNNNMNWMAHYHATAAEIWKQHWYRVMIHGTNVLNVLYQMFPLSRISEFKTQSNAEIRSDVTIINVSSVTS